MAIFLADDMTKLLHNKFVVIIGDSIQRGIYKDMVVLLQGNRYLQEGQLKAKGELHFEGDVLVEGGRLGEMTNKLNYREVRQYRTDHHLIRFYFTTRSYSDYMETILADLADEPQPDVLIMNSCLWDITRYGPSSVPMYKKNLKKLFGRFKEVLPEQILVIWNTTLPVANSVRGGFLIPEVEFKNETLRLDILEANYYARDVVVSHGYDVLDMHYNFRYQLQRRVKDGVHWNQEAHRRMTNLLLSHVTEAWGYKLPRHVLPFDLPPQHDTPRQYQSNPNIHSFTDPPRPVRYVNSSWPHHHHASPVGLNLPIRVTPEERYGGPIGKPVLAEPLDNHMQCNFQISFQPNMFNGVDFAGRDYLSQNYLQNIQHAWDGGRNRLVQRGWPTERYTPYDMHQRIANTHRNISVNVVSGGYHSRGRHNRR
ncbi:PC-esterase domain-containing protein 1A-like [Branchiostoma lanceolatum]|uniref:PC-esterase domain-containing protein 1A-like n=1 Tax=Branchiostoma lanceolatum TaxID=7740 RepID=UPI0034564B9E